MRLLRSKPKPSHTDGFDEDTAPKADIGAVVTRKGQDPEYPAMRMPRRTRTGYAGPGGGRLSYVEAPMEYRGTTVQVCGMWPFGTGSTTPMIGVPMGRHLYTGATVCFDPISWYTRARLINNPSVYIESEPG